LIVQVILGNAHRISSIDSLSFFDLSADCDRFSTDLIRVARYGQKRILFRSSTKPYLDVFIERRVNATPETFMQITPSETQRLMSQRLVNVDTTPRLAQTMLVLIPPLSLAFRSCSVTDLRAASRDLGWYLGEPGEPKSSSHFESTRDSSLTNSLGKDYAA
jgi:hypothetical protein